jgi:hypothetical protein
VKTGREEKRREGTEVKIGKRRGEKRREEKERGDR